MVRIAVALVACLSAGSVRAGDEDERAWRAVVVSVVDAADGRPIEGVRVEIRLIGTDAAKLTDASGKARLRAYVGRKVRLRALAPGHDRFDSTVSLLPGESRLRIPLTRGTPVGGLVLDAATGRPLAGARVHARLDTHIEPRFSDYDLWAGEVRTDEGGRFRFPELPSRGRVVFRVVTAGHEVAEAMRDLTACRRDPADATIRVAPAGRVTGQVLDPAGRPAAGVRVFASRGVYTSNSRLRRIWHSPSATTGPDGRFVLEAVAFGVEHQVGASSDDHASPEPVAVRLSGDDSEATVRLRLLAFGSIRLRVVDPEGKPVQPDDVSVTLRRPFAKPRQPEKDGGYGWGGLPPGRELVEIEPARHPAELASIRVRPGKVMERVVTLRPAAPISGTVVDEVGRPVEGAEIAVIPARHDDRSAEPDRMLLEEVRTDTEGRFRIPWLTPAAYLLRASSRDRDSGWTGPVVAPTAELVIRAPRLGLLVARFRPPDGMPPPERYDLEEAPTGEDAYRSGWGVEDQYLSTPRLGCPGGLVRQPMPAGSFDVILAADGSALILRRVRIEPGKTTDLGSLPLEPCREMRGRVQDATGRPLGGGLAEARLAGIRVAVGNVEADGTFALRRLPAGAVMVTARGDDHLPAIAVVSCPARDPVRLVAEPGGEIRVLLRHADGKPVEDWGHTVIIRPLTADVKIEPEAALGGERLPPGRYRVEAWRGTRLVGATEATVKDGESTKLEIILDDG